MALVTERTIMWFWNYTTDLAAITGYWVANWLRAQNYLLIIAEMTHRTSGLDLFDVGNYDH